MINFEESRANAIEKLSALVDDPKRFTHTVDNLLSKICGTISYQGEDALLVHHGVSLPIGRTACLVIDTNEKDGDGYRGLAVNASMPMIDKAFLDGVEDLCHGVECTEVAQMQQAAAQELLAVFYRRTKMSEDMHTVCSETLMNTALHHMSSISEDFKTVWNESAIDGPSLALCIIITSSQMLTKSIGLGMSMPDELEEALIRAREMQCLN